jgi:gliding motility-associated-like protein
MKYILTLTVFFLISSLQAQTIYVDSAAITGANNGTSWTNAYTTLSKAVSVAASGNNILIAKGTYYPTGIQNGTNRDSSFLITAGGIKLYGGYNSITGIRNIASNPTILSGDIGVTGDSTDNSYHVIVVAAAAGVDTAIVDGFTVTSGNANDVAVITYNGVGVSRADGAGIIESNNTSLIVVRNCLFTKGYAGFAGGGAVNRNSTAIFSNTIFNLNQAAGIGGGLYCEVNGTSTVINCTFSNNLSATGFGGGGAIGMNGAKMFATACIFNNNIAKHGTGDAGTGGVLQTQTGSDTAIFTNCLLTNNSAIGSNDDGGGAIIDYAGEVVLNNCTLYNNTTTSTTSTTANSIHVATGAVMLINNTIIYGTDSAEILNQGTLNVTNSLVKGYPVTFPNLDTDPLFVNAAGGNFRLTVCSPVINEGLNSAIPAGTITDLDNNARTYGPAVDMGAYELQSVYVPSNRVLYVDSSVAVSGDGKSWAGALKTLSEALYGTRICTNVDSILVAKGTYYPTGLQSGTNKDSAFVIVRGGVKVYGGYNASTGNRDIFGNKTILDGDIGTAGTITDNSYHVMVIAGLSTTADSVVVDGFTIQNANGGTGAGYTYGSTGVSNNYGGGIALFHDHNGQKTVIRNCALLNNKTLAGAGISILDASPAVAYDIFSANTGTDGGGMQINTTAYPVIANCIITGNKGIGAGIENSAATPYIVNCTISGNTGGSVTNWAASTPIIANCIIYGNSAGLADNAGSLSKVTYSILQNTFTGVGNLNVDPLFTNALSYTTAPFIGGDYTLQSCSQAINMGRNDSVPAIITIDYAGNPRIYNSIVDRGAYEYQLLPPVNKVIYVDSSVTASGDGTSWSQAFKTLSEGLTDANNCLNVDSVLVAKGAYFPTGIQSGTNRNSTFQISRGGIKVYGGYNSSTGNRDIIANASIMNGDIGVTGDTSDNSVHVLLIGGITATADSIIVDGFTIENGHAFTAGSFTYATAGAVPTNYGGGGVIFNCLNNQKTSIRNCNVLNNAAVAAGGFSILNNSNINITNCLFSGNTAGNGGAIQTNGGSSPVIENSIFNGNKGSGAGIENSTNAATRIFNCTFSGNTGGSAIANYVNSTVKVANSIIYGNANGISDYTGSVSTVTYSIVQNAFAGVGNLINVNPLFTNAPSYTVAPFVGGDYTLQPCSPAINAGDNDSIPAGVVTDYINNNRIYNTVVDMGAYEYQALLPSTIIYVDSAIAVSGNGTSWSQALKTLSDALKEAKNCIAVDTILVAKGTYYSTGVQSGTNRDTTFLIPVRGGLKVFGGYSSSTGNRDISANATILDGDIGVPGNYSDDNHHVLVIAGLSATADSVVIDGFTVEHGYGDSATTFNYNGQNIWRHEGGGIEIWQNANKKIAIRNCTQISNHAVNGGGMELIFSDSVLVSNCSFINNNIKQNGSGIYNYSAQKAFINNCIFSTNIATSGGGGIFSYISSPVITNSTFTNNTATQDGGGIMASSCTSLTIDKCAFTGNVSANATGGGIYSLSTTSPVITNTVFTDNKASQNGGGIYTNQSASTVINNCSFIRDSTVTGSGGGVADNNSSSVITNDTFNNNVSSGTGGGGLFSTGSPVVSIASSSFINNSYAGPTVGGGGALITSARANIIACNFLNNTSKSPDGTIGSGGGIQLHTSGADSIINTLFANNVAGGTADDGGGGLMNYGGITSLINCTFYGNTTVSTVKPDANGISIASGATTNVNNSILYGPQTKEILNVGTLSVTNSLVKGYASALPNLDTDPLFVNVLAGNYNLTACSPAINAGLNSLVPASITKDLDSNTRIYNSIVDMGAYEFQSVVASLASKPTVSITQPTCAVTTGTLAVTAPTTGVTYSFDNGATFGASSVSPALVSGTYEVIVQNASGCNSIADTVIITAPLVVPSVPTVLVTQPTCAVTTGTLAVTAPTTGVTYSFDNGATFGASSVSPALVSGTYEVIVQNASGCNSMADTVIITAPLVAPSVPTVSVTQPTCTATTGTLTVTAPTTGVTYSFDNGATFGASSVSPALVSGTYEVIVQNASGCNSMADTVIITAPLVVPSAPTVSVTQPTCAVTTGTLTVTAPATGVTYSFDNGATFGASLVSLALVSGTYEVIVQNASGCNSIADTVIITVPLIVPSVPTVSVTQPTCTVTTGTLTVTAPTTGVTYSFDNGATFGASSVSPALISGTYEVIVQNTSGCNSIADTVIITAPLVVPSVPTVSVTQPTCTVTTGTLTVTAPATGVTYSFDNGATFGASSVSPVLVSGTYEVIVQNTSGCNSIADTVIITAPLVVPSAPTVSIIQPTCTIATGTINVTAPTSGVTYSFDNGTTFSSSAASASLPSGNYEVLVQDISSGCPSAATTTIIDAQPVTPGAPAVSSPVTYCKNATVSSLATDATGTDLTWYTTAGGTGSSVAPTPSSASAGNTTYYVSDKNGVCEGPVSSIIVTINALVTPQFTIADSLCLNTQPISLPVISDNNITGVWNESSISTILAGNFTYTFIPNNPLQCAIDTTISIVIKALPEVSVKDTAVIIKPGASTLLTGIVSPVSATYSWGPANNIDNVNSLSPTVNPPATQQYTLTASLKGCTASAVTDVHVLDQIFIPTAFSPNNDNINDKWTIDALNQFPRAEVEVFNRSGKVIFQSSGNYMAKPWDGLYEGNFLPTGTYVYIINLNSAVPGYDKPITGCISIIR